MVKKKSVSDLSGPKRFFVGIKNNCMVGNKKQYEHHRGERGARIASINPTH